MKPDKSVASASLGAVAPVAGADGLAAAAAEPAPPVPTAALTARRPGGISQERLIRCLTEQIDELRGEVHDTKIFSFVTARDPHIIDDIRRAAEWVTAHDGEAGHVQAEDLAQREPRALERLPRLAIAQALGRLHRSGSLGLPTFEHPANASLLEQLRAQLDLCVRGEVAVGDLQERVMRAVAGGPHAPGPAPEQALTTLVEQLAGRPIGNERDIVAMATELALEPE